MISIRTITPKQNMSDCEVLEKLKWLDVHPEVQCHIDIWAKEIAFRLWQRDKEIQRLKEYKNLYEEVIK